MTIFSTCTLPGLSTTCIYGQQSPYVIRQSVSQNRKASGLSLDFSNLEKGPFPSIKGYDRSEKGMSHRERAWRCKKKGMAQRHAKRA